MPWERQPLLTLGLLVFQLDGRELVDHEDDAVAACAGLVDELFWADPAGYLYKCSLGELCEGIRGAVLAPDLAGLIGYRADCLLTALLRAADGEGESGFRGVGELTDLCVLGQTACYDDLICSFHNR